MNGAISDGYVARGTGIDAVCIASGLRRHDLDAPCGEAVGVVDPYMEVWRVAQGDLVKREAVGAIDRDEPGNALLLVCDFRGVREVPPGHILVEQFGAATAIDGAVAHDAAVASVIDGDQRLASMAFFADDAATAWSEIVEAWIARGNQRGVGVYDQRHAGTQRDRAG
jgi:hypothetical protein